MPPGLAITTRQELNENKQFNSKKEKSQYKFFLYCDISIYCDTPRLDY